MTCIKVYIRTLVKILRTGALSKMPIESVSSLQSTENSYLTNNTYTLNSSQRHNSVQYDTTISDYVS